MEKRLFVDMDGTLAEFKSVDNIETLYEKGYFRNLMPIENVVSAVRDIINNHPDIEVYILSSVLSDSKYALEEKKEWLKEYIPEIASDKCIFPSCGEDKKNYVPGGIRSDDYLLDDYSANLNSWQPPARGIKLMNGINGNHGTWTQDSISFLKSPEDLSSDISSIVTDNVHIRDVTREKLEEWQDNAEQTISQAEKRKNNDYQR